MQAHQPLTYSARHQAAPYSSPASTHSAAAIQQHHAPLAHQQPAQAPHTSPSTAVNSSARPVFRPKPLSALISHAATPQQHQPLHATQSPDQSITQPGTDGLSASPAPSASLNTATSQGAQLDRFAAHDNRQTQPPAGVHPTGFASFEPSTNGNELNSYFDQQSPTSPDFFATLPAQSPQTGKWSEPHQQHLDQLQAASSVLDDQHPGVTLHSNAPPADHDAQHLRVHHVAHKHSQPAVVSHQQRNPLQSDQPAQHNQQQYAPHYTNGLSKHHAADSPAARGDNSALAEAQLNHQHYHDEQHYSNFHAEQHQLTPELESTHSEPAAYIEHQPVARADFGAPTTTQVADNAHLAESEPDRYTGQQARSSSNVAYHSSPSRSTDHDFGQAAHPSHAHSNALQQMPNAGITSTSSLLSRIRSTITSNAPVLASSFTRGVSALSNQYAAVANHNATPAKDKRYSATTTEAKRKQLLKKAKQARRQLQQRRVADAGTDRTIDRGPAAQAPQDYTAVFQAETDLTRLLSHDRDLKRQLDAKCDELAALTVTLTQLEVTLQHSEVNVPTAAILSKHGNQQSHAAAEHRLECIASGAEMQAELYRRTAEHLTVHLQTLNNRLEAMYDDNNALALIADRRSHRIQTIGEEQQLLILSLQQQLDDTSKRAARRERELREEREELTAGLKQMVDTLANENQVLKDELRGHQNVTNQRRNGTAHSKLPVDAAHHTELPSTVDDIDYSIYTAPTAQLADTPTHIHDNFHSSTDQFPLEDYESDR